MGEARGGCVLHMEGMGRILRIDSTALTVTCEPGVTLHELRSVLAAHNLTLTWVQTPPEP